MNDPKEFLETIYPDLDGAYLEIRLLGGALPVHTEFFSNIPALLEAFPRLQQEQRNVHFGSARARNGAGPKMP